MDAVYKYYLTARPAAPGAIPASQSNRSMGVVNYDAPRQAKTECGYSNIWGEVLYAKPLTESELEDYELSPDRRNPDTWALLCELSDAVGAWEEQVLPNEDRLTVFQTETGSYLPADDTLVRELREQKKIMDMVKRRAEMGKPISNEKIEKAIHKALQ